MSKNAGPAKAADEDKPKREESAKQKSKASKASFNIDEIRELADLVDEHGFTDFEFENSNIHVRLSKIPYGQAAPTEPARQAPPAAPQQQATTAPPDAPQEESESASEEASDGLHKITSPIVGTFYRSPAPDKEPYVKEGSKVSPDSVVCIVEAMKLMNEIEAEVSGEVVKIYVENGQPVEFGQPLFGIKN